MEQLQNLHRTLSHSSDLAKSLDFALGSASLSAGDSVRIQKQISDMQSQASDIESLLAEMDEQYKVEETTAKQQIWERKLLDLSLRNNLLNMKLGKNAICIDHKTGGIPDDISVLEDELDMGKEFILDQKELKGIYRAVRTNLEETGANTLFLTLGTLRWNEKEGGREYYAPILLVPIEITSMKKGAFAIRKRDEDVILNITLTEFLKQNYGIVVDGVNPLPQDAHGVDVSLVLHLVRMAIKEQPGWSVVEESVLGIFSFTKFVMWNDIHTHAASLIANPLVRSLVEGRLLIEDTVEPADARLMDINTLPNDYSLPVAADSSQMEAVVEAQKGRSFILYGPPGTGKSQTITNLIANALYHGKRVLFVAQKKAALDVVEKRLAKIGLAPFCLELHSNKMDKTHFLKQMEESFANVQDSNTEQYRKTADSLFAQRQQLVGYVDSLHRKQSNGYSLYDCINRYLSISQEPLSLPKDFCKDMTEDQVECICDKIKALDSSINILGGIQPSSHPLYGFTPKVKREEKNGYASRYLKGDSLEDQLLLLPQIVAGVKQQVDRGKTMSFMNKTVRQYVEGDYKFKKFLQLAEINDELLNDIDALLEAVTRWSQNIDKLPQWQQYADLKNELVNIGLSSILTEYDRGESVENLSLSFLAAFYYQTALSMIANDVVLSQFNGVVFEQIIEKYNYLNREFQKLTREELIARLSANCPIGDKDPDISAELTLLRKRIGNKGRGTSIRNIIDQMPNLLPRLCPVMLMSPLSVAQYLDVDGPKFDIVVFDEASQMPTSEAVGAIARGKTVVVVGDPKQMPPTSFFSVNTVDEDEADVDDLESILDDCISLSMPARYLGWHYRSKHESLIAFSNKNYYGGKLITFPSTDDMQSHVTWQHVDGYYDFGKTRTNRAEAEAIVADAIERMQNKPERSIGIIAFSKIQSDLIEDLLNEKLAELPEVDMQNRQSNEPLFVKNLENVQGDERDVILFSVGYGPDKDGKVSMNFGPLNKVGGERRLNVAVSRARYEMKVFSTLRPEQIDERRTNAEGVLDLKEFLRFAQNGSRILNDNESLEPTSNIIASEICSRLQREGYTVETNIGSSDFRIDLAVVNPTNPSEYMLGVICDGEGYYRLKTTRDREIVQPTVLNMLGWKLMHVWTIDWFLHPEVVMKNLLEQLQ